PKIGNEFQQLSRQAGFVPNKQNAHDTVPWLTTVKRTVDGVKRRNVPNPARIVMCRIEKT
ncbi:hypothetical protein DSI35_00095, partial [Mycobacterium tuberculosis]